MPIYETPAGLRALDTRPYDEPEPQNGRRYATVREAAQHGTLDDLAETIAREAVGYNTEPYWDSLSAQGYRDIGGVAGPGPWSGPLDLLPEQRRQEVMWARTLAAFSPPAKNALRLHRTYVLGQGIPMPTAQDSDVQEVIEDFWDDSSNAELTTHQGQAETDAQWLITGELFLALFVDESDGHLKVRSVEPLDVDTVVTDPDDRRRILYYRVRRHRDNFDFSQGQAQDDVIAGAPDEYCYFADWQNADPARDPYRATARPLAPGGAVMASFPLNRQGVRGIPELTAAIPWVQSHKRLLEAQSIMAEAKKKIALVKTVKGGPSAVGSAAALEQSSLGGLDFGRLERNPARAPGSTYVKNKGIELEYPDLSTGADDAQRDAELHAQMIGAATGWGTHYLLMSTEFHRLATAVAMELPTLKMCLEGQQRWLDMLRSVLDYALLWAAKKGKIAAPVVRKHGREVVDWKRARPAPAKDEDEQAEATTPAREMAPQDVIAQSQQQQESKTPDARARAAKAQRGHYQVDMPPVLERDLQPTVQAIEAAAQGGHITPEQAARQVMLAFGFGEIDDALEEWRRFTELQGAQIEREAQQAQDMAHKQLAAKAGPAGAGGPGGGQSAQPALPGTQGAATPSGGLSRTPTAREAATDVREAAGAGHWVTIEEEGIQTHVFIQGGRVTKGPAGLIGATPGHLPPGPNRTVTHHPVGHEPAGAREHPHYTEHQPPEKPEPKPGKPYARLSGAPQTRQEQPDERPEALSQEQAHAGLRAAQEAVRPPQPHGLRPDARRSDDLVAHALRYHLAQRARERGQPGGGPAAAGADPVALLSTLTARRVHQSAGRFGVKDAVFDAQRDLRVAANYARSAGHITDAEHERVHDLAEDATMHVLQHDRLPSPLDATAIKTAYQGKLAKRVERHKALRAFKRAYAAHLAGTGKKKPAVPVTIGHPGAAGAAVRQDQRFAIADHLQRALPKQYHALLQAQGASVVLHGGQHREVFPGAGTPEYYKKHLEATGRAPDTQPGGIYAHTTRQAHAFGGDPEPRVVRHELGHAVDAALGRTYPNPHPDADLEHVRRHQEADFLRLYEEHKDNHKLWSYMRTHPQELFAEGFALYHDRTPTQIGLAGDILWDKHGKLARAVSPHDRLKKDAPSLYAFFKNLPKEMEERLAQREREPA